MAEYLTNTSELTQVADAIRAKGGTSAQLVFPSGFASAIDALSSGMPVKIVVNTVAGAAVTATNGDETVSGTSDEKGNCTLTVSKAGTWTVTVFYKGDSKSDTVTVTDTYGVQISGIGTLPAFSGNDWEAIIRACKGNNVPDTWVIGDSKTMTINGIDYQIDIIGKNHDDYADGSGKAPLTFQMHDCYGTIYGMNTSDTNSGGWKDSAMRKTHLPAILRLMPEEVQSGIRYVNKKTSAGGESSTIETVADELFLLSEVEITGAVDSSFSYEGTQYAYYVAGNSIVKKLNGADANWWTRSPYKNNSFSFARITSGGYSSSLPASGGIGVAFAFCF